MAGPTAVVAAAGGGTAFQVNGIVIDPSGASATNVLIFSGGKFVPGVSGGASLGNYTFSSSTFNLPANALFTGTSSATNTTALTITPTVADGASSVGLVLASGTTLSNATAKLISVQNGTEKWFITKDGWLQTPTGGIFKILSPNGSGVIQTDDATIGTRIGYGSALITLPSSLLINFAAAGQQANPLMTFDSASVNYSTAGGSAFRIGHNSTKLYIGMCSGSSTFSAPIAEDMVAGGTVNAGNVVVWSGTDGVHVSQATAVANLTTIAGVCIVGGTVGQTIQVARKGRVLTNCNAAVSSTGLLVGTDATTAGRCNASTPGAGAIIGRSVCAAGSNGLGANQVWIDVVLA